MKDPVNDPLAVTLFIDFLAIRAGNYEYLSDLFENYGKLKNWDMLPNFLYNVSFAYHKLFEKTGDEKWKRKEKELVKTALIRFPSFVGALVDRLGLEPSDEVKKSGHFDTKLRCPKGIRILVNIVLKHSFDFWSQGYQLKWLQENATEFSKHLKEYRKEVTEWDAQ
uniref:Type I-B CRISPR-associated protein Cas8b1/Cst1 n=2 Tax=Bursaphelenchus xylophilus TaxID=6326 RepID=A0A1I7S735_BURXY